MNWTEERDKDGNPTPLAIAAKAIEEHGCDCDADCDEVHTCLAGLCEVALFDERNKLEVAEQTNASLRAENKRLRVFMQASMDSIWLLEHNSACGPVRSGDEHAEAIEDLVLVLCELGDDLGLFKCERCPNSRLASDRNTDKGSE